ncbi:MAG: tRNA dihydrouridine synthase DusB [Clostridia bacterium]|nr:tRNA dihydrouridine synthase DusB [Clostridia bacterium]MEE1125917.1 tRNA dihydrouridine synthase DusB [Acutalibacteraceae bacterium]
MKIKNVEINGIVGLAPMAGVADRAFREICKEMGAAYVVSEMVSSKGVSYKNERSTELMEISDIEHPCAVQLFGNEPDTMAVAAKTAMQFKPDILDINMGCPAPKISGNGCGCALMKTPRLCGEIVKAVSNAVDVPVTIKIRKGYDDDSLTALEVARYCVDNGASAITIHGRTAKQMYKPYADWEIIAKLKNEFDVPILGNGDVVSGKTAKQMLEQTGCDMVMVGRASLGNPWIFKQINEYIYNNVEVPMPTTEERLNVLKKHIKKICDYKGEKIGMKEARKHVAYYFKGFHGAAAFRNEAGKLCTYDDLLRLIELINKY